MHDGIQYKTQTLQLILNPPNSVVDTQVYFIILCRLYWY